MTRKMLTLVVVPCFALLACEVNDEPDVTVADPDTPAFEDDFDPVEEETVSLSEVEGSGVTGEARFTEVDGETEVLLQVENAPANASLAAHIHEGRCDDQGGVAEGIENVMTDSEGEGASTSTVALTLNQIMDGQHYIQAHGEDGQPITCGDIPERGSGW